MWRYAGEEEGWSRKSGWLAGNVPRTVPPPHMPTYKPFILATRIPKLMLLAFEDFSAVQFSKN